LRKLVLLASACAVFAFTCFAHAQEIDAAVGGGTLFAPSPITASQAFPPPAEKGGTYPHVNVEAIFENRFGFSAEVAFRYKQGLYDGYQRYRPIFSDVNGLFAPRIGAKTTGELLAGAGVETLTFYNQFGSCTGVCPTTISTNHFLLHVGGGVRYYFWRHFFARPEVNYYFVIGNSEFHSNNVVRLGASVGYTFGGK